MDSLLKYLRQGYESGHMIFAYELLNRFYAGDSPFESDDQALQVLKQALAKGHPLTAHSAALALHAGVWTQEQIGCTYRQLLEIGHQGYHRRSSKELARYLLLQPKRCPEYIVNILYSLEMRDEPLGRFYLEAYGACGEKGVPPNLVSLIFLLRREARLGNEEARFALALAMHYGIEIQKDLKEAIEIYSQLRATPASSYYHALALFEEGKGKSEKASALMLQSANQGFALAALYQVEAVVRNVGRKGLSPEHYSVLFPLARAGNHEALAVIGYNPVAEAVSAGLAGFSLTEWQAHMSKADSAFAADSIFNLPEGIGKGSTGQRNLDNLRIGAETGCTASALALGLLSLDGDWPAAMQWLALAYNDGDSCALHAFPTELVSRSASRQDRLEGLAVLQQAADNNFAFAHKELSEIFASGLLGPPNMYAATHHLNRASELGCLVSARELGLRLRQGAGVGADDVAADYWLNRYSERTPASHFHAEASVPVIIKSQGGAQVLDFDATRPKKAN